jgi:tetratricopeptide (TPR) repeat protein
VQPLTKNLFGQKRHWPVISVLFFGAFYLFLRLCVGTELIYHHFEISRRSLYFETGWPFLRDYLSYPSGLSQYLAAFLTQLCYFSWLGALCITLVAWAIYRLTASLTALAADSPWRVINYVPALLMFMICGRYENPLNTGMAVLITAFFSVMYEKFSPRHVLARGALFLIICGVLYYIVGSAVLIFVALAALYEFFHQSKPAFGVLYLLLGAAVFWLLDTVVFKPEMSELFLYSNPFRRVVQNLEREKWARVFEGTLFVGIPVLVLLVNSVRKLGKSWSIIHTSRWNYNKNSSVIKRIICHLYLGKLKWITQIALLVVITVPGVLFFHKPELKKAIQIRYFNCRREWPEVLAIAGSIPLNQYQSFNIHAANRALYHTGRMGDEMFAYPQIYDTRDLVFGLDDIYNVVLMERMELCLELGLVNVAERMAYEFLNWTNDRPNPFVLKQFAIIYITKGKIETARVFLRALSKNLIYGREAKDLLHRLEIDPLLEHDEHIQRLRSTMVTTDLLFGPYPEEGRCLEELLRINKHNRMAFEYLMAHYLLNKQLDKFVENLPRLDDFGYKSIPRHYQEAILLYMGTTDKNVDLGSKTIDGEVINQLYEMNNILGNSSVKDVNEMHRILAPKFGRTYFYYFFFGVSGITQ